MRESRYIRTNSTKVDLAVLMNFLRRSENFILNDDMIPLYFLFSYLMNMNKFINLIKKEIN